MRLITACLLTIALLSATAGARESAPATHIARLDILDPFPSAGTVGGVGIISVNTATSTAKLRVSAVKSGDQMDSLFLLRISGDDPIVLSAMPFPAGTSTVLLTIPFNQAALGSTIDSGKLYLRVSIRSTHAPYAEGPIVVIPSAIAIDPSGDQVVPKADATNGVAHCSLVYDQAMGSFRYSAWWLDLTGEPTAIRIRSGEAGTNGSTLFEMQIVPGSDATTGLWPTPGSEVVDMIRRGAIYFEIATAGYPGGELRGQIHPVECFTAAIEPENEVPAVAGASANGSAFIMITAHGSIEVFNKLQGVVGNTSGPIAAAHIHPGAIGANGPPAVTLELPAQGVLDLELASGSAGGAMSNDVVQAMRAVRTYVNVHTAAHQSGEARGQLIPARTNLPLPTSSVQTPSDAPGMISAGYLAASGTIAFTFRSATGAHRITLYTIDGRVAHTMPCGGTDALMPAHDLPAGRYFAHLLDAGGRAIGTCSVVVMR